MALAETSSPDDEMGTDVQRQQHNDRLVVVCDSPPGDPNVRQKDSRLSAVSRSTAKNATWNT